MFFEKVIFAIDNNTDLHTMAKFARLMDTKRAIGDLQGSVVIAIGMWEGFMEQAYIVNASDYYAIVEPSGYVDNQECVLMVPGDTRQPCTLTYKDGRREPLGSMIEIPHTKAKEADGWTFIPKTGKYYTCKYTKITD